MLYGDERSCLHRLFLGVICMHLEVSERTEAAICLPNTQTEENGHIGLPVMRWFFFSLAWWRSFPVEVLPTSSAAGPAKWIAAGQWAATRRTTTSVICRFQFVSRWLLEGGDLTCFDFALRPKSVIERTRRANRSWLHTEISSFFPFLISFI